MNIEPFILDQETVSTEKVTQVLINWLAQSYRKSVNAVVCLNCEQEFYFGDEVCVVRKAGKLKLVFCSVLCQRQSALEFLAKQKRKGSHLGVGSAVLSENDGTFFQAVTHLFESGRFLQVWVAA